MEKIATFPGLGLEFHLTPVLLRITDSFGIRWYGLIIAVGFMLALLWCSKQCPKFGIKSDDFLDMLFFAVPLGIVGARLYYVIFEFSSRYYVQGNPGEILRRIVRVWDGGLAIYGGIIAGFLVLLVFCKIKKLSFLAFADVGCMGLLIGQCAGRWGNFVNVEAFGSVTDVPWRMAGPQVANYLINQTPPLIDAATFEQITNSGALGVHPTFFYESCWNLVGFLILVLVIKKYRTFDGEMFLCYIAWYGIGRFFIEGLRTDSLTIGGLRASQMLALLSAGVAIAAILYVMYAKKPRAEQLYVNRMQKKEQEEAHDDSHQT